MDRVHVLTGPEFEGLLRRAPFPMLVDFHADWCAPCRWLDPILPELVREGRGRVLVAKVDVDEAPEAAARYSIGSVPTVILFRNGSEEARSVGVEPERLRSMLDLPEPGGPGGASPGEDSEPKGG